MVSYGDGGEYEDGGDDELTDASTHFSGHASSFEPVEPIEPIKPRVVGMVSQGWKIGIYQHKIVEVWVSTYCSISVNLENIILDETVRLASQYIGQSCLPGVYF